MVKEIGEAWLFVYSVGQATWLLWSGLVITVALGAYKLRWKKDLAWAWLVIAVAGTVLVASFLAWRDVYGQTQDQLKEIASLAGEKSVLEGEGKVLREELEIKRDEINELRDEVNRLGIQLSRKPPPVQDIRFVEEVVSSSREDAPYAVKVVIQTNVTTQPTSLVVSCDTELAEGEYRLAGVGATLGVESGYTKDRRGYRIILKETPFRPETPIVATLTARRPIHVLSVDRGP